MENDLSADCADLRRLPTKTICANLRNLRTILVVAAFAAPVWAQTQSAPAPKKLTLAVLPFVPTATDAKSKDLAERMRFAVSQKLSTDTNAITANGPYSRLDNVQVDQLISALGLSFLPTREPSRDELQSLLTALDCDFVIAGKLQNRTLTLTLYDRGTATNTSTIDIPPDNESPKLAVEKILTDLTGTAFARIRDKEVDHSDPKVEARFAANPNLVPDPTYDLAATDPKNIAINWETMLRADTYAPPLLTANAARAPAPDRAAIVPASVAGDPKNPNGNVLMMRMSKNIAETNGLAVQSTWIPVEHGKKYRFTARYKSNGPTARIFLKGFGTQADAFATSADPSTTRREFYRAQILPRPKNSAFENIEMDFTPSTFKSTDPQIQWLRIDLYVYLHEGDIYFDDIVLKKIDE
jgi:hypothetical protein